MTDVISVYLAVPQSWHLGCFQCYNIIASAEIIYFFRINSREWDFWGQGIWIFLYLDVSYHFVFSKGHSRGP